MAVSEQFHALAALLLGIEPSTPLNRRLREPNICTDKVVKGKNIAPSVIESRFSSLHY
jgi:hypothetical protein